MIEVPNSDPDCRRLKASVAHARGDSAGVEGVCPERGSSGSTSAPDASAVTDPVGAATAGAAAGGGASESTGIDDWVGSGTGWSAGSATAADRAGALRCAGSGSDDKAAVTETSTWAEVSSSKSRGLDVAAGCTRVLPRAGAVSVPESRTAARRLVPVAGRGLSPAALPSGCAVSVAASDSTSDVRSADAEVLSADAVGAPVPRATPTPSATARPPTRPMKRAVTLARPFLDFVAELAEQLFGRVADPACSTRPNARCVRPRSPDARRSNRNRCVACTSRPVRRRPSCPATR